jgi:hypothetical protein
MTHLRKMMLEELERRNYAQTTTDCYIQTIATPFNLHNCLPTGGFLQTAVSDAPAPPPEPTYALLMGRIRYGTSVSG